MAEKRRLPRRRAGAVAPTSGGSKRRKRSAGNRRPGAPPAAEPVPENPPPADPEETCAKFPIVGIGASAGGLEACSELLSVLPENAGMALVVVQHLAPKHHSILPDLLQASSHLPVVHASEGIEVAPNHVYVIPPNVQLRIAEGKLWLLPRPEDRSQYMPIDYFFHTLAEYAQAKAIGVILSGTASDGAEGLREIKGVGGITIAQDPRSAKYDGMPRAAIATGFVDLVLRPQEMAEELINIGRHPLVRHFQPRRKGEELGVLEDHFDRIFLLLRSATGVDFSHYKLPTIKRRLQRRMVLHKMTGIEDYLRYLHQKPEEIQSLYQDILIHVTRFFREPDSFKVLAQKCFPELLENRANDAPIRIWVPGCSTGEDAYSTAMALLEFLDETPRVPIQLFGTDISQTAVEHARSGFYSASIAADVSAERLRRHFTKTEAGFKINKTVRDFCVFARQDLTRDPPFSKLDLILCRNVMIYLTTDLQRSLLAVFHYALKPSGFLMLGNAETTGPNAELFSLLDKRHKLYLRKPMSGQTVMNFSSLESQKGHASDPARPKTQEDAGGDIQSEASRIIIGKYAPPGVIIDHDLQIVQFRGHTGAFLEPAPGEANLNVLKMAREGLLYGLRAAIYEARKTERPSRKDGLRVKLNNRSQAVNLEVVPLSSGNRRYFLVLFERAPDQVVAPAPPEPEKSGKDAARKERRTMLRLEQELAASREYLQSIIQDLEAANEELQSANEEIISANEELQSTNEELDTAKEELQSTNEELNTLNEELHGRNEELSHLNSDLVNLLASVQIAIVMVSGDLRIRRFTPMAEKLLNLIPTDVGRPISDIKPNVNCPDLKTMITEVVDSMHLQEQEVQDAEGNCYSLRIRPYKSLENRIDGAVVSLFQIDSRNDRSAAPDDYRWQAEAILETVRSPLVILDRDLVVTKVNKAFCDLFGLRPEEAERQRIYDLGTGRPDFSSIRTALEDVLSRDSGVQEFEVKSTSSASGEKNLSVVARRLPWGENGAPLILLAMEVITQRGNS